MISSLGIETIFACVDVNKARYTVTVDLLYSCRKRQFFFFFLKVEPHLLARHNESQPNSEPGTGILAL